MADTQICDKCFECYFYWQNNDSGSECHGQKEPCHEFVEIEVQK